MRRGNHASSARLAREGAPTHYSRVKTNADENRDRAVAGRIKGRKWVIQGADRAGRKLQLRVALSGRDRGEPGRTARGGRGRLLQHGAERRTREGGLRSHKRGDAGRVHRGKGR